MRATSIGSVFGPNGKLEENKVHVLIYEGDKTEEIYFKNLLEIVRTDKIVFSFSRDDDKKGWSNPKKILNLIDNIYTGIELCGFTYETIIENIYGYLIEYISLISINDLREDYNKILEKLNINRNDYLEKAQLEQIINILFSEFKNKYQIEDLVTSDLLSRILSEKIDLSSDRYIIHLIVDRDKKSFTTKQYKYVLNQCKLKKINFYVTNPFFEFWLLLHFSDCSKYSIAELEDNDFVIEELKKFDSTYQKNSYDVQKFIMNTTNALINASKYENDINKLENKLGTNIPSLLIILAKK